MLQTKKQGIALVTLSLLSAHLSFASEPENCLDGLEKLASLPAAAIVATGHACKKLHFYNKTTNGTMTCTELRTLGNEVVNYVSLLHDRTFLHAAAQSGDLPIVQYLGRKRLNVDAQDSLGNTALHYAAQKGHMPVIRALIIMGANPRITNKKGIAPLAAIIRKRLSQFVQELDDECPICLEHDNDTNFTVSCLQCSTPICKPCRANLIASGTTGCPICRRALARHVPFYKPSKCQ